MEIEVSQLSVRKEHPLVEEGGSDTGADSEEEDSILPFTSRAEFHLCNRRSVGIVNDDDRTAGARTEKIGDVRADPGWVDIRGSASYTGFYSRRHRASYGTLPVEMLDDVVYCTRDGSRPGTIGRLDPMPLGSKLSGPNVDGRALDSRTADVDSQ